MCRSSHAPPQRLPRWVSRQGVKEELPASKACDHSAKAVKPSHTQAALSGAEVAAENGGTLPPEPIKRHSPKKVLEGNTESPLLGMARVRLPHQSDGADRGYPVHTCTGKAAFWCVHTRNRKAERYRGFTNMSPCHTFCIMQVCVCGCVSAGGGHSSAGPHMHLDCAQPLNSWGSSSVPTCL